MDTRVNACLDGELPLSELTPAERRRVDAIRGAADAVRAAVPPQPDMAPAVLRRIWDLGLEASALALVQQTPTEESRPSASSTATAARPIASSATAGRAPATRVRGLLASLWQPQDVSFGFRPAWAFGLVVALTGGLLLVRAVGSFGGTSPFFVAAEAPPVFVQFRLEAEGAGNVALAGSFTQWEPQHEMVETRPGVWTLIVALEPGVHDYAFLVDGQRWVVDPVAPTVEDGFGGMNSRLSLLPVTEGTL